MPVEGMDETTEIHDFDVLLKALASISTNGPVPAAGASAKPTALAMTGSSSCDQGISDGNCPAPRTTREASISCRVV
jgi:hypothetical protein